MPAASAVEPADPAEVPAAAVGRVTPRWTIGVILYGIALIAWTKKFWSLAVAMLATVLVPLLAFTIMEAVVTA